MNSALNLPRVLIAGTGSGCGKTTVACAVLQALVNRRLKTGAFKCGPDYIDPMFHSKIIGAECRNLDLFFLKENTVKYLLCKNAAGKDISVIEGVMGYYDGLGCTSTEASAYHLAKMTKSPVILVLNAKGASLSILATLQGFLDFCPDSGIRGVILNQCSASVYDALSAEIIRRFDGKVKPLGYLPKLSKCVLESRHLGLVTADEVENLKEKMQTLAACAEKTLDINGILRLASEAEPLEYESVTVKRFSEPVRIAVARDKAFCFYYEDSLSLLRDMGAELVPFSPLSDRRLPEGIHGLYLGGGYPELYAEDLSANTAMRQSIRDALQAGLPCIAECGGFMYLTEAIEDKPMVGFLHGNCINTGKLTRFGYVTLTARKDNMLCRAGEKIPGHEFHHYDCDFPGDAFSAEKHSGKAWDCVIADDCLYAGFPHFHFYANPVFAENFYTACLKEKHRYD